MKLAKTADLDKYGYSFYGIGFHECSQFSLPDCSCGKNVIIFRLNNSFSVHIDDNKKKSLVLAECPTQGLDNTTITAEAKYISY